MKWLTRIMYGMFALVLILGAGLLVAPSVPLLGHVEVKIVKSGSMEPHIMTGGIVLIREASSYREGDVITFASAGSVIPTTHRIVGTEVVDGVSQFVTKGDANEERDTALVPPETIKGKVLFTVPYVGFILDFARQPLGFFLLVGIPALLIVIDEVDKIVREMRRLRREKKGGDIRATIAPLVVAPYTPPPFRARMMDINKPILIATKQPLETPPPPSLPRAQVRTQSLEPHWTLGTSSMVALLLMLSSFVPAGNTLSYFSDTERSLANLFGTISLDFNATADTQQFILTDGVFNTDTLTTTIALVPASAPVRYDLTVPSGSITGNNPAVCDAVVAKVTAPFAYEAPITGLSASGVLFDGPWTLDLSFTPGGAFASGDTCTLEMVYSGWNAMFPTPISGYKDEERIALTFTVVTTGAAPALFMDVAPAALRMNTETTELPTDVPAEEGTTEESNEEVPAEHTPSPGEPVREEGRGSEQAAEVLEELAEDLATPEEETTDDEKKKDQEENQETLTEESAQPEAETEPAVETQEAAE